MKAIISTILAAALLFGTHVPALAAVSTNELQAYLSEVQLTQEEFEAYLASYDLTVADFEDVSEIRDILGPRVTTETLQQLLEDYDMTRTELEALLSEYDYLEEGKTIEESFLFISDVEEVIYLDMDFDDIDFSELDEDLWADMDGLFTDLGITDEELTNFVTHLVTILEQDPTILDQLEALSNQMMEFEDFDVVDELTPAQIATLLSITTEMKNLLQLDFSFYLVTDGVRTPISFESLLQLTEANDASLFIEVYNLDGVLLMDLLLTGDMVESDLITNTGEVISDATNSVASNTSAASKPSTVKGGELPKTAGNYAGMLAIGTLLLGTAFFIFRKGRAIK